MNFVLQKYNSIEKLFYAKHIKIKPESYVMNGIHVFLSKKLNGIQVSLCSRIGEIGCIFIVHMGAQQHALGQNRSSFPFYFMFFHFYKHVAERQQHYLIW